MATWDALTGTGLLVCPATLNVGAIDGQVHVMYWRDKETSKKTRSIHLIVVALRQLGCAPGPTKLAANGPRF
jgi:hypothetical protein